MHTNVSLSLFLKLHFLKFTSTGLADALTREMKKKLTFLVVCKCFKLAADTTNFFYKIVYSTCFSWHKISQ